MKGVLSTCRGGISALSAFSTGMGSSAAIDIPLSVYMEKGGSNNLTEALPTLSYLDDRYHMGTDYYVEIESSIPSSVGLKSSSAFTTGIVLSYLSINGIPLEDSEIIRIAAEASIANGTSITGAADDISSSFLGGCCIADNRNMALVERKEMAELPVLVMYSDRRISTRDLKNKDFSSLSSVSDGILAMIKSDRILEAMVLNGFIYGSMLGIDAETIGKLYDSGALYAGQSGKGPALFAVFGKMEDAEFARAEVKRKSYASILTRFTNRRGEVSNV